VNGHDPLDTTEAPSQVPPALSEPSFPWPPSRGSAFLDTLGRTWAESLFQPARFFASMPLHASLGMAMLFQIGMGYAGAGADLFWRTALPAPSVFGFTVPETAAQAVATFLLAGPLSLILAVIAACLVHIGLIIFGARRHHADSTLRVLLFASSTYLFQILPVIGGAVAAIWWLVIVIVGIREVHGTSTGRAAAAVLIPALALATVATVVIMALLVAGVAIGLLAGN
jgi:hypothetical protein